MIRSLPETHPGKWVISYLQDSEYVETCFPEGVSRDRVFTRAAELEAFSDCYDISSVHVHHAGRVYRYAGWQPRMLIEFENEFGVVVWSGYFPEWNH